MTRFELREHPVIAILRGVPPKALDEVALALMAGGVHAIEVTLTSEAALSTIARWRARFGADLRVGAGTVLDAAAARDALLAGAEYLISPHTDEAIIDVAREGDVPVFPGALTPTEILRAHQAGATAVKVFPVARVGGPAYLRDVLAPLRHVPVIAVGGVDVGNAGALLHAGAVAVGVGSSLTPADVLRAGRFDELTARAHALVTACLEKEPA